MILLRRFLRSPSLLLVLLIAATVGGVLSVVKFTIIKQDKLFILHSQEMVASGLQQQRQQIIGALREYSVWDSMSENVNPEPMNLEWLASNMSGSAYVNQHINIEAIVDRDQRVNYLLIDGQLVPPDTKSAVLTQLIAELFPRANLFNPYGKAPSPAGYVKVSEHGRDNFYLVVMEPIVPENGIKVPANGRFLLFASVLDATWTNALAQNFRLLNPQVKAQPGPEPSLPLICPDGSVEAYLAWQLDMPGRTIFTAIMPFVLALLAVLIFIAMLLGRLASHLHANQLAQAVGLAAQGDALRSLALSKEALPTSEAYAHQAAELARTTLQLPHLSVWELDEASGLVICKASAGQSMGFSNVGERVDRARAPWLFTLLDSKKGLVIPDLERSEQLGSWVDIDRVGALLAMPTLVRDRAVGLVLAMNPWPRSWRPDEINFLASIADMLALSMESQARKRAELELAQRIYFDELTELPNRVYLGQQVQQIFGDRSRFACVLVSVEGLVHINDRYGVAAGGQLLVGVAQRLLHFCGPGELVGRAGDNRFALVLDMERGVDLQHRMAMLFGFFASPVKTGNISLLTRLRAGACYFYSAADWEVTLHNAEIALQSLHAGSRDNVWVEYSSAHHAAEQDAQTLREDLQSALGRDELFLLYQPIVNLTTGRICGAEALIRWQHPARGLIGPVTFIPMAEATGVIYSIGLWVLRQAMRQLKDWQGKTLTSLSMSVNVSMVQLEHSTFADDVSKILQEERINPTALELEITEGIALSSAPEVSQNLARLRAAKIGLAIDDFGTGYASFSYLRRFEAGKLKIDRMFLEGVPDSRRNDSLVRMIIAMGHTLNAKITGEGIETADQAAFLRAAGCEFGQGFHFGRPLSPADFTAQLTRIFELG